VHFSILSFFPPPKQIWVYPSTLPGNIIQALAQVRMENPLILTDVDEIERGVNGDLASALLEMLDLVQNNINGVLEN